MLFTQSIQDKTRRFKNDPKMFKRTVSKENYSIYKDILKMLHSLVISLKQHQSIQEAVKANLAINRNIMHIHSKLLDISFSFYKLKDEEELPVDLAPTYLLNKTEYKLVKLHIEKGDYVMTLVNNNEYMTVYSNNFLNKQGANLVLD